MHRGYIKIYRKLSDSGLLQMPNTLALFLYLLMNAAYKPVKVGTPNGIVDLQRGQYLSGRKRLASDLKQSEREIRTSLSRLIDLQIIDQQTTSKYSVYTIVNYGIYQDCDQQTTSTSTNKRPANDQQTTTKQEREELKELKELNSKPKSLASRLPQDWKPTDEDINFIHSTRSDLDVNDVADSFRDYWHGVAGAKGRKLDWPATWRNWVRNQKPQSGKVKNDSGSWDKNMETFLIEGV